MNKVVLIAFLILNSATAQTVAEFSFSNGTNRKFGKTPEGKVLEFEYTFTNTGKDPLIITEYKVACTCTKVEFPKAPIAAGEKGVIKVSFDTRGKIGYQDRIIELYSNAKKNPVKLRFRVNVDNKHPLK